MDEETIVTTPSAEGSSAETGSQVAEPSLQEPAQSQSTDAPTVEGAEQSRSSPSPERPKASEFYEIRNLKKQVRQLSEQLSKMGSIGKPEPSKPSGEPVADKDALYAEYFKDPIGFQERLLEKKIKALEDKYEKQASEIETQRAEQEALEILFPKDQSRPNEKLEDRIRRDIERGDAFKRIIEENGLGALHPVKQAKLAMVIYKDEQAAKKAPVNPAVPKKGQMASTATGTPVSGVGGLKAMNLNEVKAENKKMEEMLDHDPELRYDEKFVAKREALKSELHKRFAELSQK